MAPLVSSDVGWDNPLAVFLTYPEGLYHIGSEVKTEILVYNKTQPYDPYNVSLTLGIMGGREINVTRKDVGHYNATFTIEEADVEFDIAVFMEVEASEGGGFEDTASQTTFIWITSLDIDLEIPDSIDRYPSPGQTVEFNVLFSYLETPVDPDPGTIEVVMSDSSWTETPITVTRVQTGVYAGSFTIPSDLKVSEEYELGIDAEYTIDDITLSSGVYFVMFEIELYSVWVHVVEATPTASSLEIYAMDANGDPLKGAPVWIEFGYWDDSADFILKQQSGTMDNDGKTTFTETFVNMDGSETEVRVKGLINHSGYSQAFKGSLEVRDTPLFQPESSGLSVHFMDETVQRIGTMVNLEYTAYFDGSPLTNHDIYAYIVDNQDIYYTGIVKTDGNGKFTLSFTTPASVPEDTLLTEVYAYYQAEVSGEWDYDEDSFMVGNLSFRDFINMYPSTGTSLTVNAFEQGGMVDVTLTSDAADGLDEEAFITWGLGSIDFWDVVIMPPGSPDWAPWTGGDFEYTRSLPCTWSDGAYHATFPYPPFIPLDTKVFIISGIMFADADPPDGRIAVLEDLTALPGNEPPMVIITSPEDGGTYLGAIDINGTASDDTEVTLVEIRIDGGEWTSVTGTTEWGHELDTTELSHGSHTIEARAFDDEDYSDIVSVTFIVDQPPMVTIAEPADGGRYGGTITATGSSSDDSAVVLVEVRIDGGEWMVADDIAPWSYSIDTTLLSQGTHTLEARSSDDVSTSPVVSVEFIVDQPPAVEITSPADGQTYGGALDVGGTASDDVSVQKVEVRVDEGTWIIAEGTDAWTYELDTMTLSQGTHSLEARSYDGYEYSAVASVSFDVDQPPTVSSINLQTDVLYDGTVNITGGASDDVEIMEVEIMIDEGPWMDASGTTSWWYELDTTTLAHGEHVFEVRTYDGTSYSEVLNVTFKVDQPPTLTVTIPVEAEKYKKKVEMAGTTADDDEVLWVEFNLDGGEWTKVEGNVTWSYELSLKDLKKGNHTVELRSWDGNKHSDVISVTFKVEEEKDDGPGFGLSLVLLSLLAAMVYQRKRRY
jgi:hypothetical protein